MTPNYTCHWYGTNNGIPEYIDLYIIHSWNNSQQPAFWLKIKVISFTAGYVIGYVPVIMVAYTETKMSSFWRNFNHWLHWKLSFWQLPVQPVMKISSKWRYFRFSVAVHSWELTAEDFQGNDHAIQHTHQSPRGKDLSWLSVGSECLYLYRYLYLYLYP